MSSHDSSSTDFARDSLTFILTQERYPRYVEHIYFQPDIIFVFAYQARRVGFRITDCETDRLP